MSYPRRWGKSVMIESAARIRRRGSVKVLKGPLSEAKQPVLMPEFKENSVDEISEYICDEIWKLARRASLFFHLESVVVLQRCLIKSNAVRAVRELSEALELKDKERPLHILIDEYDYPIIKSISPLKNEKYAKCMDFYQDFVAATKSVRGEIVVTGVSQIKMDGTFSGANHLVDVTFQHQFNGLLGQSWEQILDNYDK